MTVIDTHCDALLKLQLAQRGAPYGMNTLDFRDAPELATNFERLQRGGVKIQFYAIFIEPDVPFDEKWQHALEQIDLFYSEIIDKNPEIKHVLTWSDATKLKNDEMGAVLTLEGADAFGNDLVKLRQLYRLGVLAIGMTWNNANLCADGAGEPRGGGLTVLGKDVVKLNNSHHVFTDVSHATVKGFWDILEYADYPFASHSNSRALCEHRRNLYDDQAKAMFAAGGLINVVFNPPFVNANGGHASISDLIKHIDHFCALGGEQHIGFGSDFDGISSFVDNLGNAGQYPNLINELQKQYSESQVEGFAYRNFMNHLPGMKA